MPTRTGSGFGVSLAAAGACVGAQDIAGTSAGTRVACFTKSRRLIDIWSPPGQLPIANYQLAKLHLAALEHVTYALRMSRQPFRYSGLLMKGAASGALRARRFS